MLFNQLCLAKSFNTNQLLLNFEPRMVQIVGYEFNPKSN